MRGLSGAWAMVLMGAAVAIAAESKNGPVYDDPAKAAADPDFAIQGEYSGTLGTAGDANPTGVQVIALGHGKFKVRGYGGGLPGDGWDREDAEYVEGELTSGTVVVTHENISGTIRDGVIDVYINGDKVGELTKANRESPTMGKQPPEGAVVLFGGNGAAEFKDGKTTDDGLLMPGCTSNRTFGDCTVHIEFRLPFMPEASGQARGNSGIYLMGRYEVQMLDSFGLPPADNESGGLYKIAAPQMNMCYPPLSWQTYDIDVTAPRFDAAGKKTANARLTVRHNGVIIHENQEVPGPTTAAPLAAEGPTGPIYLQNHGTPARYRNVWVLEKK